MERAGHYLRARESAWSEGRSIGARPEDPGSWNLLMWESLLADGARRPHAYPKNRMGGMASIGLFGALFVISLGVGLVMAFGGGGLLEHLPAGISAIAATCVIWGWVVVLTGVVIAVFWKPIRVLASNSAPALDLDTR